MLRLSSILQLQSVWDTIPSQSSLASSPATLSRHSSIHIQPGTLLTSAASLVLEDNIFSTSSTTPSLPERSSSVLPTPSASLPSSSSIQADDSQPPTNDSSNSDALYHAFEQVHPLTPTATSHLQDETLEKLNSSSNITAASTLPPLAYPPPVPRKDSTHHLPVISRKPSKTNKVSDHPPPQPTNTDKIKKKEKRSSKYGFFGSRSAATAPPLPPTPVVVASSMIPSPTPSSPPLIDGANKTLRRETSKFNLRRKSLSKKVKRAISNIKLNGTTAVNDPAPPLPPILSN